jgi:ribonucleoside-diphosphate reductase beta chain
MSEAETVALVERADVAGLGNMDIDDVYVHVDYLLRELPGPLDLYQRWEAQQWSASTLDFSVDKDQWQNFHPEVQRVLEDTFSAFYIGEQAVTDTLAPLMMGAPDEESRLFLSTQVVDEARHAYFFARFFGDALGVEGTLREKADHQYQHVDYQAYHDIFDPKSGELVTSTNAVRDDPGNYAKWVQGIAVYHVMVEGMLALGGQRFVLKVLGNMGLLPAFRAGFTAVTRDESRHVNYGIWALRRAVREGHEKEIKTVVDRTIEPCSRIFGDPTEKFDDPRNLPPPARQDPRETWGFAVNSLTKRLRALGLDADYTTQVDKRAWDTLWQCVDEYEKLHSEEHPVRVYERGEVSASLAS